MINKFKILTVILSTLFLVSCSDGLKTTQDLKADPENRNAAFDPVEKTGSSTEPVIEKSTERNTEKDTSVPKAIDFKVLFASQAPFGNWDELHGEACEEASMIMAARYFKKQPLDARIMEEEILKLVDWEKENKYNDIDATAEETAEILERYFGLRATVDDKVTVDNIKNVLAQGKLIIVPAAGRMLENPNFKQPGPIYHMLLIRGYDRNEFITNDPGTRKGEGYKYKYGLLTDAVHDWDHGKAADGMTEDEMKSGKKIMIVVSGR
ncbi:hypothetical protein C4569_03340 [Candidatus Parcubacteria bacterium]|nr:MAG: hypothetical protein C4569_03340 [Candidatus Parcubacteria bacterium]